jgi:hypothetical protein
MPKPSDDSHRPEMTLAYLACAVSGAIVGFVLGAWWF